MFGVKIENKKEVDVFFKGIEQIKNVRVLNELAKAVGYMFRKEWKGNFDREGVDDYRTGFVKWKDIKPKTKARRIKRGFGVRPILQNTKRLYNSVIRKGNAENINMIFSGRGLFGTSTHYGIYHQSRRPRKVIPRRQFVAVSKGGLKKIARMGAGVIGLLPKYKDITWRKLINFANRPAMRV